ncbi:FAD-binding oxidoreductase [Kineosporia mesophila]|uniref:FAD-binding oxidoreductase n=1 Tax=Kineosporia mesophila TaxID=566012 RepID=A0ABP6ZNC9_9ACTN|nr:FAD-binding oxidoreductase [Kineosporia mesophila]MCD5354750.1 FAD-binding oxidoreductase [Kineosporia mesophila]
MTTDLAQLAAAVSGPVLLPGGEDFAAECATYNLMSPLEPAIAVGVTSPRDIQEAVRFAARHHLPVAVRGAAHCVARPADGALLISLRRLSRVQIDPARATARIEGAATWDDVVRAAAPHGLAPMAGSSPTVSAIGYLLGGGQSPLFGRVHGYASDHVTQLTVITADGELRDVTATNNPDLFFALRGGKGNFGVVSSVEVGLVRQERVYAGGLYFAGEQMAEVLQAWSAWVGDLPEEMSSSVAIQRLPPAPELPPPLQGAFVLHLRVSYLGDAETAEKLLAPMRAAAPIIFETLRDMPMTAFATIHADPPQPIPYVDRSTGLKTLPTAAVEALTGILGPESESPLVHVEIRSLGGALDRAPQAPDAVSTRGLAFQLFAFGVGGPDRADILRGALDDLIRSLEPWADSRSLPNFLSPDEAGTPEQVQALYGNDLYARLSAVKARYDPANLFRINHNVAPAVDPDHG